MKLYEIVDIASSECSILIVQWQLLFLAWKRDCTYQQLGMCKIF